MVELIKTVHRIDVADICVPDTDLIIGQKFDTAVVQTEILFHDQFSVFIIHRQMICHRLILIAGHDSDIVLIVKNTFCLLIHRDLRDCLRFCAPSKITAFVSPNATIRSLEVNSISGMTISS